MSWIEPCNKTGKDWVAHRRLRMSGIEPFCRVATGVVMEQDKFESEDNGALKGVYADCFRIGHSAYKFVLDFGQFAPDGKENNFHTRVITGPDTAKLLVETVGRSLKDYEHQFGRIPQSDE